MKRKCAILLALISCLSIFSGFRCVLPQQPGQTGHGLQRGEASISPPREEVKSSKGAWNEDKTLYTCNTLGVQIPKPEGWVIYDEEDGDMGLIAMAMADSLPTVDYPPSGKVQSSDVKGMLFLMDLPILYSDVASAEAVLGDLMMFLLGSLPGYQPGTADLYTVAGKEFIREPVSFGDGKPTVWILRHAQEQELVVLLCMFPSEQEDAFETILCNITPIEDQ